jgi:LDH2 family malate/lactate/ureidoglycolate dehydrogenase
MDKLLSLSSLQDFSVQVFKAMGCSNADAQMATKSLIAADLSGVDSHGVARLSGYFRLWEAG